MGLARPVGRRLEFDITYHIRRSALPSPGGDACCTTSSRDSGRGSSTVAAAVGDVLVEGLAKNRTPSTPSRTSPRQRHDGVEIGHVIADRTQKAPEFGEDIWIPAREPSDARLVFGAVGEWWPARPPSSRRSGPR